MQKFVLALLLAFVTSPAYSLNDYWFRMEPNWGYKTQDGKFEITNCGLYALSKNTQISVCLNSFVVRNLQTNDLNVLLANQLFKNQGNFYTSDYSDGQLLIGPMSFFGELGPVGKNTELALVNLKKGDGKIVFKDQIGNGFNICPQVFLLENKIVIFCIDAENDGTYSDGSKKLKLTTTMSVVIDRQSLKANINTNLLKSTDPEGSVLPTFVKHGDELVSIRLSESLGGHLYTTPKGRFDSDKNLFIAE